MSSHHNALEGLALCFEKLGQNEKALQLLERHPYKERLKLKYLASKCGFNMGKTNQFLEEWMPMVKKDKSLETAAEKRKGSLTKNYKFKVDKQKKRKKREYLKERAPFPSNDSNDFFVDYDTLREKKRRRVESGEKEKEEEEENEESEKEEKSGEENEEGEEGEGENEEENEEEEKSGEEEEKNGESNEEEDGLQEVQPESQQQVNAVIAVKKWPEVGMLEDMGMYYFGEMLATVRLPRFLFFCESSHFNPFSCTSV